MDFDRLTAMAKARRDAPYEAMPSPSPALGKVLDELTYGPLQDIKYPPSGALYASSPHPITFFHMGKLFRRPVRMFALEGGLAREVVYSKTLFSYPPGNPAEGMPDGAGFAGFRSQNSAAGTPGAENDWMAFLGASYFRMAGDGKQYGVSARGIAVDTAPMPGKAEEFPDFTRFYVSPDKDGVVTVLALLEGRSVTGVYRFALSDEPNAVTDVDCRLFFRHAVDRLGIAPMTSMLWYSEGISKYLSAEFRPEIHDSDGLLMRTGTGEVIWRPLNNPPAVSVSAFSDTSPKGFGLLQRDRSYENYIDEGFMERRPHLWVEPKGDWGAGSVQLVEIPAHQEYDDNIVAMWVPRDPVGPGQDRAFSYRLRWPAEEPLPGDLPRCIATRASKAVWLVEEDRIPGRENLMRQFVIDFEGKALVGVEPDQIQVSLAISRGQSADVGAWPQPSRAKDSVRIFFKVYAEGPEPVEIRLSLAKGERALSETWLYRYHPEQRGTVL